MRLSRMLCVSSVGGLLFLGCSSQSVSVGAGQCDIVNPPSDRLAIIGTAKPGKVQAAFQDVEGLALTNGGCLVSWTVTGQEIDIYSIPPTTQKEVTSFAQGMRSSGKFASVVQKTAGIAG